MILVDVTHTSHCRANTGIQRVTRRIVRELAGEGRPVVHDRFADYWRMPDGAERRLTDYAADIASHRKRGAVWTVRQKLNGALVDRGWLARRPLSVSASGIIVPEVFAPPRTAEAYSALSRTAGAPVVGVFNDLIPLLVPDHTPAKIVANFEAYLETLRSFDAIAAISEFSRDSLVAYWTGRGLAHPPVVAIPLGVDVPDSPAARIASETPVILCVGTLEGRKNHHALLLAAESLWSAGVRFELVLFGGANLETAGDAVEKADRLMAAGRPLRWIRGGSDVEMEREYARASFTVYPSLMEGFGLPVLESLARGVPCVCSGENAMAETARDGGCLVVGHPSPEALATGFRQLLESPATLDGLRAEAVARKIRTWSDYVADLRAFVGNVAFAG